MPSPPLAASRLVWILALPVHTPVSSTWLRCWPSHSGASLTPGLSLLSFCRLALCSGVSSRFCLSAGCIIDISVDQLCGSLHESEKCVRARRETSPLRFYPMARVGFRETWVRMPHGSTYPSPSSRGLQGDKAGRQVCPPELRTPQPCAVLQVQMRKAHGTQDVGVLFVREYLVAPALPKRVMVSDRPHLLGLPRFGVLNHPYRWLTWTVKPVSPPSSTGRPSIRVSG